MTAPKPRFLPGFWLDLVEAIEWYEARRPGLGRKVALSVDEAVEFVREWPRACPAIRDDVRRKLVGRFPYTLVYKLTNDQLTIIGVMHGAMLWEKWLRQRLSLPIEEE